MDIFNRQTMEQIAQRMIDFTRGTTKQLTDFRVGSPTRTLYESFAIATEDLYDRMYKGIKRAIQQNLYTAFGFTALPAVHASGTARMYAQNPPPQSQPFYVPLGTQAQAAPTNSRGPVLYTSSQDAYLYYNSPVETEDVSINGISVTGWYYVDVPVVCVLPGEIGNVEPDTIQVLVGIPSGISAVTNAAKFTNGKEAEDLSAQKARFQLFLASRTRGTLASCEYGATTAVIMDPTDTFVQERVESAIVVDGDGTFAIYIWNGVGVASTALITAAKAVIDGYIDPEGNRVWGYKPAGIPYTLASVDVVNVPLAITVTPRASYGFNDTDVANNLTDLRPYVTSAVSSYFAPLKPGQTFIRSGLESALKQIQGVYDVVITAPAGNVTATSTKRLVPTLPITFTKGNTV